MADPTLPPTTAKATAETPPLFSPTASAEDQSTTASECLDAATDELLVVTIRVQRGRLAALVGVVVVLLTLAMVLLQDGHALAHFTSTDVDGGRRTKLLDDYNSYSANVVSALGEPIQYTVKLAVQVVVLRLLAAWVLSPEQSWRTQAAATVLAAGVGYLVNNGFNAVNVRLRSSHTQYRILGQDLTQSSSLIDPRLTSGTTNLTSSVSESTPRNSIANTVLHDLVLPHVPKTHSTCEKTVTAMEVMTASETTELLEVGFPQREWFSRLLPEALPVQRLSLVANPTNASVHANVYSEDLPMNASRAANLFMYAMLAMPWYDLPVRRTDEWFRRANRSQENMAIAKHANVLPRDVPDDDEASQREWFLRESPKYLAVQTSGMPGTSLSDIKMTFSHVDITPHIHADAVTIELEVDPALLGEAVDSANTTRVQYFLQRENCGSSPARCLVSSVVYYDPPVQTDAFAACLNADGTDELRPSMVPPNSFMFICGGHSKTSIFLVTMSKRLVADDLYQKTSVNATGWYFNSSESVVVVNLRKIFAFTMVRLAWEPEDLSATFDAKCDVRNATASGCMGLHVPLEGVSRSSGSSNATEQELVVGVNALPIAKLSVFPFVDPMSRATRYAVQPLTLVQVHGPTQSGNSAFTGDILLPHNVKEIRWDWSQGELETKACSPNVDTRLQQVLSNHLYMEEPLQTTYTAAMFFFFQDATVKDVIGHGAEESNKTALDLDGNVETVALWVSTPAQNAQLTMAGCALLVAGLFVVAAWPLWQPRLGADPLARLTTANDVARVMLDEAKFPPRVLHREVIRNSETCAVGDFAIAAMTLQHRERGQVQPKEADNVASVA